MATTEVDTYFRSMAEFHQRQINGLEELAAEHRRLVVKIQGSCGHPSSIASEFNDWVTPGHEHLTKYFRLCTTCGLVEESMRPDVGFFHLHLRGRVAGSVPWGDFEVMRTSFARIDEFLESLKTVPAT